MDHTRRSAAARGELHRVGVSSGGVNELVDVEVKTAPGNVSWAVREAVGLHFAAAWYWVVFISPQQYALISPPPPIEPIGGGPRETEEADGGTGSPLRFDPNDARWGCKYTVLATMERYGNADPYIHHAWQQVAEDEDVT